MHISFKRELIYVELFNIKIDNVYSIIWIQFRLSKIYVHFFYVWVMVLLNYLEKTEPRWHIEEADK